MTALGGGQSSPLMTGALIWANEGILDPPDALESKSAPADRNPDRIEKMNPIFARILFVEALKSGLIVSGSERQGETNVFDKVEVSFDTTSVFSLHRPGPETCLKAQAEHVLSAFDLRADRMAEIFLQQSDVLSFLGSTTQLNDISQRWTLELLRSVLEAAMAVVAQVKHIIDVPRPVHFYPELAPIIQTPQHSTIPSGHAAEGMAAAYVLSRLLGHDDAKTVCTSNPVFRMASRIAMNRTVAGVHFPMDSMAGGCLGITLGRVFWSRITQMDTAEAAERLPAGIGGFDIDGRKFGGEDFNLALLKKVDRETPAAKDEVDPTYPWLTARPAIAIPANAAKASDSNWLRLEWILGKARQEMRL